MELKNIFNKDKSPSPPLEKFLALEIQESQVKSAVWQIRNNQPEILNFGTPENWEDQDSLLLAADRSLGTALKDYPQEPNRIIFGLPESWVKGEKITSDKQKYIKDITEKLELEPIGFVVITEAIIQQLKISEGIPPSLIILELAETKVNVVVIKLGKVIGRQEVGRSTDLGQDVEEGLARIEVKQLPSRMLIIDGSDPDIEQQLSSYPWQERLPFLHLPKVEKPDPHFSVQAVALAGGTEAARSLGIKVSQAKQVEQKDELKQKETPSLEEPLPDQDFVTSDIAQTAPSKKVQETSPPRPQKPTESKLSKTKKILGNKLSSLLSNIRKINPSSLLPSLPKGKLSTPWAIVFPILLLLILSLTVWFIYSRVVTTQITIYIEPRDITQSLTLAIADQQQEIPTLSAESQTIELTNEGSIPTTGETTVGEPAAGEVVLYNKTNSPKELESGTVLVTDDNLKFTLDEEIRVASQTATTNEEEVTTLIPGQATSSVTAQQVGEAGNISSGTELSVSTFPKTSLLAKAGQDFSGGYSETVKSPNQSDLEKLLQQVTKKIVNQSKDELKNPQDDDQTTVPVSDPEIISTDYSAEPGDPADTLSLKLRAEFTLLSYKNDRLTELIQNQLSDKIPSGWKLDPDHTQTEFISLEPEEQSLTAKIKIQAQLLPEVPSENYKQQLKRASVNNARRLLENIAGYQKAQITLSPNLPILSRYLPPKANNINISIEPLKD